MRLASQLAGFSPGEADQLRRCINAWRTSLPIEQMAQRLMQGLIDSGLPPDFAKLIFKQIQGFSQYGFPESHAASFALLAYASCFLKAHHPAEFACSLVNSQPMGFYRNDTILYEALRNGVKIFPVCLRNSEWDCKMENGGIRLGFRLVSGISKTSVEQLLQERKEKEFSSLQDLLLRSSLRKDVLHKLAMAGRFADFNFEPRQALWAVLEYERILVSQKPQQLELFSQSGWEHLEKKHFQSLHEFEVIQQDYAAFSLSTHGHPMIELRKTLNDMPKATSLDLKRLKTGSQMRIAGLVLIKQRPPTAKGMVFTTLEDEFGFIDVVLRPDVFEKHKEVVTQECFIIVSGKLQVDVNTTSLLAKNVEPLFKTPAPLNIEPDQYFW